MQHQCMGHLQRKHDNVCNVCMRPSWQGSEVLLGPHAPKLLVLETGGLLESEAYLLDSAYQHLVQEAGYIGLSHHTLRDWVNVVEPHGSSNLNGSTSARPWLLPPVRLTFIKRL
jgi:hypothetical protein